MFWHLSIKKALIILLIFAALGSLFIVYLVNKKPVDTYTTAAIHRGRIVQTVSETGTVKAAEEINLSFLNSGKIRKIYFDIGAKVNPGDILAELDYSALVIKKNEAGANLDAARQNLLKLQAGATTEEIAVARANLDKASSAYESAKKELEKIKDQSALNISQAQKTLDDLNSDSPDTVTTYEQAITAAETNLKNTKLTYQSTVDNAKSSALVAIDDKLTLANTALDTINTTITDEDGKDLISVEKPEFLVNTKAYYKNSQELLAAAKTDLSTAKTSDGNDDVLTVMDEALSTLQETFSSLGSCYSALENSITSSSFTQSDLDTLKSNISAQQTLIATGLSALETAKQSLKDAILAYDNNVATAEENLNTAKTAYNNALINADNALASAKISGEKQILAAEAKLDNAKKALNVSETELSKLLAPPNKYDISLQEAKIRQAKAVLDSYNKQIEDSIIKAPIKGVITKVNYEEGEQASPSKPIMSMLGENDLEIEVLISEADIAKVKKNNPVDITFDAFGEDLVFTGKVSFIEPAETIIQDVVYYKVTINFDSRGENIKSGMTANVTITTAEKNDVLIAPSRSIVERGTKEKFIRILANGKLIEKPVSVGLRGDEGRVEILSGAKENEEAVTYIKKE